MPFAPIKQVLFRRFPEKSPTDVRTDEISFSGNRISGQYFTVENWAETVYNTV
jgi:hypothetical protein